MKLELDSWLEQRYGDRLLMAASACFSELEGKNEMFLSSTGKAATKACASRHIMDSSRCEDVNVAPEGSMRRMAVRMGETAMAGYRQ